MATLVCLVIAAVLFFLGAIGVGHPRVNMTNAGLFFCVLAILVGKVV